jgi:hypothetical protein
MIAFLMIGSNKIVNLIISFSIYNLKARIYSYKNKAMNLT